jgi:hypothetical protein
LTSWISTLLTISKLLSAAMVWSSYKLDAVGP